MVTTKSIIYQYVVPPGLSKNNQANKNWAIERCIRLIEVSCPQEIEYRILLFGYR